MHVFCVLRPIAPSKSYLDALPFFPFEVSFHRLVFSIIPCLFHLSRWFALLFRFRFPWWFFQNGFRIWPWSCINNANVGNAVAVFRIDSRRLSTCIVFAEIQIFKVFIGLCPHGSGRHGIKDGWATCRFTWNLIKFENVASAFSTKNWHALNSREKKVINRNRKRKIPRKWSSVE